MKLEFLPFLLLFNSVRSNPRIELETTTLLPPSSTTGILPTYDYVVEFGFTLDENKIPEYLVNIIYDKASNKSITTDDIFILYGLKTVDLNTTLNYLQQLEFSPRQIFSLDGFEKFLKEIRMDFKEFYNRVIINGLNITGNPLRDVLVTLNIDVNNFSMAMAYGDPDPFDEFKKGNFTYEAVLSALEKANRTMVDLFVASRNEFVTKALTLSPETISESLMKYNFDKKAALNLWNILGLTMMNVYSTPGFQRLLNDLNSELNQAPCLGVLTGLNDITINRRVYDIWRGDEQIVQPFAECITRKFILNVTNRVNTEYTNMFRLKASVVEPYSGVIDFVKEARTSTDIENCKYVTLSNDAIIASHIAKAINRKSSFHIPRGNITNLVIGSPLICDRKLYGLAREISGDEIILDSFSSCGKMIFSYYLMSIAVFICVSIYFL